jgi:hypothetical protein
MDMEPIETQLKKLTPELSMHESQVLWSRIDAQLSPRGAMSPKRKVKRSLFRAVTAGFVILGLLGGTVITAYASEALPGDTLYPTKITIERAQILFSPEQKKKDLQLAFADRRMKEVSAVLADVEEEPSDLPVPTLMAVSLPAPEEVSVASQIPTEGRSGGQSVNTMMKTISSPDVAKKDGRKTEEQLRTTTPGTPTIESTTQEGASTVPEVKQVKKWKNLENKKKALAVAIHELERSRKELEQSGATSTSERVDSVIVNLTELNSTGTTPDEEFVEKIKNHGNDMLKQEDEKKVLPNEDQSDKKSHDSSFLPSVNRTKQTSAVVLGVGEETLSATQQEIDQVKVRNEERRKKFQQNLLEQQTRIGEVKDSGEKRVPVCLHKEGEFHELLVLEKNLSHYANPGFTLGSCPPPSLEPVSPASSHGDSQIPEQEERGILGG